MTDSNYRDDDHFGRFEWDDESYQWIVPINVTPHEDVTLSLPPEYFESEAARKHIRTVVGAIVQNERDLREYAVDEMVAEDWYQFYWDETWPLDRDKFIHEMNLGLIEVEMMGEEFVLWYEFANGREHGILIYVTWDGVYQHTQTT